MSIANPILILCFTPQFNIVFLRIIFASSNKLSNVTESSPRASTYFNVSFNIFSQGKCGYVSTTVNDTSIKISGILLRLFIMLSIMLIKYVLIDTELLALLISSNNLNKLMFCAAVPLLDITGRPGKFIICLLILVADKDGPGWGFFHHLALV